MSLERVKRLNQLAVQRRALRTAELDVMPVVQKAKALPYFGYVEIEPPECARVLMFSNNDDLVAMQVFWHGCFEPASIALWSVLAEQGCRTILDVGSYTGLYGLLAAALSRRTKVIAFEPVARIHARLLINRAVNGLYNLEACHAAIGAADAAIEMNLYSGQGTLPTGSSIAEVGPRQRAGVESVAVRSLDSLRAEKAWQRVGLVKIDVERHECEALQGMRSLLTDSRPDMLIEMLDGEAVAAVLEQLASFGLDYRCFHIDEEGAIYRELSEPDADLEKGCNFLLTVRESAKLDEIFAQATDRALAWRRGAQTQRVA